MYRLGFSLARLAPLDLFFRYQLAVVWSMGSGRYTQAGVPSADKPVIQEAETPICYFRSSSHDLPSPAFYLQRHTVIPF